MQSAEDLFSQQRLFDAHQHMQAELSSEGRIQHATPSEVFAKIRQEYRRVYPCYDALQSPKAWPSSDDIQRGQCDKSKDLWRVRSEIEIPAKELVGVLMQPALWVPLVLPGALVSVEQNDAFSCNVTAVVPSAMMRALDVKYFFTQTLYCVDKSVLVFVDDEDTSKTPGFGQHMFVVREDSADEAVLDYIVRERNSSFMLASYLPRLQDFVSYMHLGRTLAKIRETAAQFYMCDATIKHFKSAFQKKTTVLRWLDAVFAPDSGCSFCTYCK